MLLTTSHSQVATDLPWSFPEGTARVAKTASTNRITNDNVVALYPDLIIDLESDTRLPVPIPPWVPERHGE